MSAGVEESKIMVRETRGAATSNNLSQRNALMQLNAI